MIHLEKPTTKEVQAIQLRRLACVNNPFIKGLILTSEKFAEKLNQNPSHCCKKCASIFNSIKHN